MHALSSAAMNTFPTFSLGTPPQSAAVVPPVPAAPSGIIHSDIKDASLAFEAVFIGQMLTHSGLADAFTTESGGISEAMSGFIVEAVAEPLAERGGFGLAAPLEAQLLARAKAEATP